MKGTSEVQLYQYVTMSDSTLRESRKAANKAAKRTARMQEQSRKVVQSNLRDSLAHRIATLSYPH